MLFNLPKVTHLVSGESILTSSLPEFILLNTMLQKGEDYNFLGSVQSSFLHVLSEAEGVSILWFVFLLSLCPLYCKCPSPPFADWFLGVTQLNAIYERLFAF